jgi:hypothetical protein
MILKSKTSTLFDEETPSENTQLSFGVMSKSLDIVRADFIETVSLSWEELFDGFDILYAITYSSSIDFICKLLKKFKQAEIIFGFDEVMSYSLQEIMAYQLKTVERIRESASKNKLDLLSRIDDDSLRLFVSRRQLSHEKLYILKSEDETKTRVIMGSANMSYSAFSGRQRENICCMDNNRAFEWYYGCFESLKENSSDNITSKAFTIADAAENIEAVPVAQTVAVKKALVIEPETVKREEIRFGLDVKNLAGKFAPFMPKADKKGAVMLTPEIVKQTRRRLAEAEIHEQELRSEYPQLLIDTELQAVSLNGKPFDLCPAEESIAKDVALFLEYMKGYEKFHGDVTLMQSRYYEFAVWFFVTPFLAYIRNTAVLYNQNLFPYPVFGLVYGQSKAGKTTFLETLLKMMIGQKTKIGAPEFTRSAIEQLKRTVKGAPIIVDDLTQTRFTQHAIETIKNDDFGAADRLNSYPAVVISANEDVKAVAPEIIRRTVICRVQAGLKNTEIMKSNIVRNVQKNIGTAFYREYLRRMLEKLPAMLDELTAESGSPDIIAVSSDTIFDIIREHTTDTLPFFVRRLTLENFFSEKVTGYHAIKAVRDAWKVNKKAFVVDRKSKQLRYNAAQVWEADRIIKELPEDLYPAKAREWIIMDLDKACDFFGVNFRARQPFIGIFKQRNL